MSNPIVPPKYSGKFASLDPLDSRYFDDEISQYLSEGARIYYQAQVEGMLARALADAGVCSQSIADEIIKSAANIDLDEVAENEKVTKHDVKALVNAIKAHISDDAKPFVHFGATSYDIVSTAFSIQFKAACDEVVLPRLRELIEVLIELADKYKDTTQIGRTHGQHGVPITFGFAVAGYVARLADSYSRIEELAADLRGKFSGAVGGYNALSVFVQDPIEFERRIVEGAGLKVADHADQIVPAEHMVRLIDELAITAGVMANIGHDMRHLQRSEINEVKEAFGKGQAGSSTMAHKRNPWNFENVVSMSKQVTAQIVNAHMNLPSEHQRDLTDSASSRFYPLVFALVASMTGRLSRVMSKIEVDEQAMERNLTMSGGAIAAEPLYLLFEKHGHTDAHELAKQLSQSALEQGKSLVELIEADKEALDYWDKFTQEERKILEQPEKYYTGLCKEKAEAIITKAKAKVS